MSTTTEKVIVTLEGYVENDQYHSAVALLVKHPRIAAMPLVYRIVHGAMERLTNNWVANASSTMRTRYRDMAVLHTMVAPRTPIFEYPDGVPISQPVMADEEDTQLFEKHSPTQQASVVICFEGPAATVWAAELANYINSHAGGKKCDVDVAQYLRSKDQVFKFAKVHDCRQHSLET